MDRWLSLLLQFAIPVLKSIVYAKIGEKLDDLSSEVKPAMAKSSDRAVGSEGSTALVRYAANATSERLDAFFDDVSWDFSPSESEPSAWELQKERFVQAKNLQQQFVEGQRETLLKLAARQRETTLKLPEVHQILEHWPLRLFPSQLLETHRQANVAPLRIFLAPPHIHFEQFGEMPANVPALELRLAQGLREFLGRHYPLHGATRPTEFLGGAWESKRFHSESSIKALFGMLASEPTLILESETDGDRLNFRMAYWGLGQPTYYYRTLFSISYRELLEESAKQRALKWKIVREKLFRLGKSVEEVNRLGGDNCYNLQVLEEAQELQQVGIDPDDLCFDYRFNEKDFEVLYRFLLTCHSLVAGWMADIHHLIYTDAPPLLPSLLPQIVEDSRDREAIGSILNTTISIYRDVLKLLAIERPYWQPELTLKLALSLAELPDKSWARSQLEDSLRAWVQQRRLPSEKIIEPLEAMRLVVTPTDEPYVELLQECLQALDDRRGTQLAREMLQAIAALKHQEQSTNFTLDRVFSDLSGTVQAVAISPDRDTAYSCTHGNDIQARSLLDGAGIRTFNGHSGGVLTLALSGDGCLLAGSDRSKNRSYIRIWELPEGKLQRTLFGHRKGIHSLAIAPDGRTLASGSHKIKLWNLETGEPFQTLFGHKQWVYALAIAPDSRTIVSGSEDNSVRVWDGQLGELRRTLYGHRDRVRAVAVSPDGQTIASGGDDHTIRLWDFESGQFLCELSEGAEAVNSLIFTPDGKYLVSSSQDKTVKIWHLERHQVVQTLVGHTAGVKAIALSPDGQTLVSGGEDRTMRVWHDRWVVARQEMAAVAG